MVGVVVVPNTASVARQWIDGTVISNQGFARNRRNVVGDCPERDNDEELRRSSDYSALDCWNAYRLRKVMRTDLMIVGDVGSDDAS